MHSRSDAVSRRRTAEGLKLITSVALMLTATSGCQFPAKTTTAMMPTPAIFWNGDIDPFAHVSKENQTTALEVFYASDHVISGEAGPRKYDATGRRSQYLRLGVGTVQFGPRGGSWQSLSDLALNKQRSEQLTEELIDLDEYGVLGTTVPPPGWGAD
jgi:hypothetical protein